MIDQLLRALGGAAEAVSGRQSRQRATDAANAEANKYLHTEAQKAADAGDWQWMYDNEDALSQHIHPDVLNALVSKTKLNNARMYDAETADGGTPTIPLSPRNVYERGQMAGMRGQLPNYSIDNRPDPLQSVMQAAGVGGGGPYNGEVGGFASPDVAVHSDAPPTGDVLAARELPPYGPGNQMSSGKNPPGLSQTITPADMSTAAQPSTQGRTGPAPFDEKTFNTKLTPQEEVAFQSWKQRNAPRDSGEDYDLRGAFKAGLQPDPETGHWPDTFKKPNHPTFSDESQYAQYGKPGRWDGETYVPPQDGLVVPPNRAPINTSRSIGTAIGNRTITKNIPGTTGKEVLASLVSQGEATNTHPQEIIRTFNQENIRRLQAGQPALDFDEGAVNAYRTRHWEQTRAGIQRNLAQQGMDPAMAFQQSATMAFNQTGYVPEQWMQVVKPHPEQAAAGAYHSAIQAAGDQLQQVVSSLQTPLRSVKPSALVDSAFSKPFLLQAVDSVPGLTPEARTRALHELANTSASSFLSAIGQTGSKLSPQQQNYFAMSMASKAVGGNVPDSWRAFVERDLDKLGLASKEDLAVYQGLPPQLRPDPLDENFGRRLSNTRVELESRKANQQAYRNLAKTPEGLQATEQMFAGKAGATPQNIGATERGIALNQRGAEKQLDADTERKNAIIPTAHLEKLQTADGIYKAAREAQQLAMAKDKSGQTILDKYGSTPGTWREFTAKVKGGLGKADPQLTAYLNRLAKVYNYERHSLTGAATSVYEGSALQPYLPAPDDNIRTGLQKLNNLTTQLRTQLDSHLEQAQSDYPRSNHGAFYRNKERTKEAADNELSSIIGEARKRMKKP